MSRARRKGGAAGLIGACSNCGATTDLIGYTARQMELMGDVEALTTAAGIYNDPEEDIPLSFSKPDQTSNIISWQKGPNLYSSIRLTGWDGQPRVLTATTPYAKAMGVIVGYAEKANHRKPGSVTPAHLIGMAHAAAQQLGAAGLIPQLCAAAPSVLRAVHGKQAPLVLSTFAL